MAGKLSVGDDQRGRRCPGESWRPAPKGVELYDGGLILYGPGRLPQPERSFLNWPPPFLVSG
jgi:hypothetical protein